jgi:hypothetical protein
MLGEALALAGVLALGSEPSLAPGMPLSLGVLQSPLIAEARPMPGAGGLDAIRASFAPNRDAPCGLRFAAGLGASLAWDLADLPRRHARWPDPIGSFTPGAALRAHVAQGATREGGAIGALIHRWNTLYPPYAMEGTNVH